MRRHHPETLGDRRELGRVRKSLMHLVMAVVWRERSTTASEVKELGMT